MLYTKSWLDSAVYKINKKFEDNKKSKKQFHRCSSLLRIHKSFFFFFFCWIVVGWIDCVSAFWFVSTIPPQHQIEKGGETCQRDEYFKMSASIIYEMNRQSSSSSFYILQPGPKGLGICRSSRRLLLVSTRS